MKRLRVLFVCLALQAGVFAGVPMVPDDIRALLQQLNQPALANVLPDEKRADDGPAAGGAARLRGEFTARR